MTTIREGAETTVGDVYDRCRSGSAAGRGAIAGWTRCPLCLQNNTNSTIDDDSSNGTFLNIDCISKTMSAVPKSSKSFKLFSHGRGLAAHLHAVHTPWKPGKAELKRRRALHKRMENEQRKLQRLLQNRKNGSDGGCVDEGNEGPRKRLKVAHEYESNSKNARKEKWEPNEDEIMNWNQRVMDIVALVESEANKTTKSAQCVNEETNVDTNKSNGTEKMCQQGSNEDETSGRDRSGNVSLSYRDSLHPFLAAAANGDLGAVKKCIADENQSTPIHADEKLESQLLDPNAQKHVKYLLSHRDRNGSNAEHWACGGGHLECVAYLLELRDMIHENSVDISNTTSSTEAPERIPTNKKVRRRRDGKTSLHYAARNGHNKIIDLLLSRHDAPPVDISSGDGSTPLHMACYGGHPSTVKHLIETHDANAFLLNEFGCGASHWAAMSIGKAGQDEVIELCEYLKKHGVDFVARQKQGHAALHKAASRKNRHVIEWLAKSSAFTEEERKLMGSPDVGGHRPSDIWLSVRGGKEFGLWMEKAFGW